MKSYLITVSSGIGYYCLLNNHIDQTIFYRGVVVLIIIMFDHHSLNTFSAPCRKFLFPMHFTRASRATGSTTKVLKLIHHLCLIYFLLTAHSHYLHSTLCADLKKDPFVLLE